LKKLFSSDELQRVQDGAVQRKARMTGALAAAALAEMDKTLAFSVKQRAELEPLLRPLMDPMLRDDNQEYWSYQAYQLFNSASKVDEKKLATILDEAQLKQWKGLVSTSPNYSRSGGVTVTSGELDPEQEKPDIEVEISRHLHQLGVNERKRLLELMLAQVGDAKRVLGLPEEKVKTPHHRREGFRRGRDGGMAHSGRELGAQLRRACHARHREGHARKPGPLQLQRAGQRPANAGDLARHRHCAAFRERAGRVEEGARCPQRLPHVRDGHDECERARPSPPSHAGAGQKGASTHRHRAG
jgi:hypothetical protein